MRITYNGHKMRLLLFGDYGCDAYVSMVIAYEGYFAFHNAILTPLCDAPPPPFGLQEKPIHTLLLMTMHQLGRWLSAPALVSKFAMCCKASH